MYGKKWDVLRSLRPGIEKRCDIAAEEGSGVIGEKVWKTKADGGMDGHEKKAGINALSMANWKWTLNSMYAK